MKPSLAHRSIIDDFLVLKPLPGGSSVGKWLRYEPIYEQIRQARERENPQFSQGIWQHELKKADWTSMESLCGQCLMEQTKDLHIMIWLIEAWTNLDGMQGLIRGLRLLTSMATQFWPDMFPYPEEPEARQSLFAWLDKTLAEHMFYFAITFPREEHQELPWTLAEWRQAQRVGQLVKRTADPQKELQRASAAGEPTLPAFETSVLQTDPVFFGNALGLLAEVRQQTQDLKNFLDLQWGNMAPAFGNFQEVFLDLERIWHRAQQMAVVVRENATVVEILDPKSPLAMPASSQGTMDRDDAYQKIKDIAVLLQKIEPHSLTPYLLTQIAQWKDKNLPEILQSLSQSPSEYGLILQLLARDRTKSGENSSQKG
jgi:type VI secretion system protein ImpA